MRGIGEEGRGEVVRNEVRKGLGDCVGLVL